MYYEEKFEERYITGLAFAVAIAVHVIFIVYIKPDPIPREQPLVSPINVEIVAQRTQVKTTPEKTKQEVFEPKKAEKKIIKPEKKDLKEIIQPPKETPTPKPVATVPSKIVEPKVNPAVVAPPMSQEDVVENESTLDTIETPIQSITAASETSDSEVQNIRMAYLSELRDWLLKHKRYPSLAKRRKQEGQVSVRFVIDANGGLISHQILKPSSHKSLNQAVMAMVERAAPMPPVPNELHQGHNQFEYTIPVNFELLELR